MPEAAIAHGRAAGRGGRGHPRRRRRIDPAGGRAGRRRGGAARGPCRWSRRWPATGHAGLDRHLEGGGRRGGARRRRRRSSTTSPRCAATREMAALCAERGCRRGPDAHAGRRRGRCRTNPRYDDVVDDVRAFLAERIEAAVAAGVAEERIWLDPGDRLRQDASSTTSSCCAGSASCASWAGRSSSAPRARASSAGSTAPGSASGSAARSPRSSSRSPTAPTCSASTTSPRSRQALAGSRRRSSAQLGLQPRGARWSRSGNGIDSRVEVELRGLSIYTHHGVTDAEREIGQRLEFDVSFDVPDCDAVLTDRIEDTVDYAEVCDIVALAATERSYRTLERLAQVDRRAADRALRLRVGAGARRQAGAAAAAGDPGGRGRGRPGARAEEDDEDDGEEA